MCAYACSLSSALEVLCLSSILIVYVCNCKLEFSFLIVFVCCLQVTNQNEENQLYLLKYNDGVLIDTLIKLYRHCDSEIQLYPVTNLADKITPGAVIREVLLATLKVLINLTHDFNNECKYSACCISMGGGREITGLLMGIRIAVVINL